MASQFTIPNYASYLPKLPTAEDPAEDIQDVEDVTPAQRIDISPEEREQQLWNLLLQRLNVHAPQPPPAPQLSRKQMFGLGLMHGPIQEFALKRLLSQSPEYQSYQQESTEYEAGQKQIGDLTQLLGQQIRGQAGARPYGTIRGISLRGEQATAAGVPDGTLAVQEFVRDPMTGSFTPGKILAYGAEANRILEMQGGFGAVNPYTLGTAPVIEPGQFPLTPGGNPTGNRAQPKPPGTDVQTRESFNVLVQEIGKFKQGAEMYAAKSRTMGSARATMQQFVRGMGETGQSLSEQYGDPELEALAAVRGRIGKMLARMVENNRLSDQDVAFAMQQLPTVASLNTPEGRQQFAAKIEQVERELRNRLRTKALLQPELFTPEERAALAQEQAQPAEPQEDPAVTRAKQLIEERRRKRGGL